MRATAHKDRTLYIIIFQICLIFKLKLCLLSLQTAAAQRDLTTVQRSVHGTATEMRSRS